MQYQHEIKTDSQGKRYKVFNGTWYNIETDDKVIEIIDEVIMRSGDRDRPRLKFTLGEPKTGEAWGDIDTGYVGRSTGSVKIPLVIHSRRSMGGGGLLTHCIIKIEHSNKKNGGTIYNITKK